MSDGRLTVCHVDFMSACSSLIWCHFQNSAYWKLRSLSWRFFWLIQIIRCLCLYDIPTNIFIASIISFFTTAQCLYHFWFLLAIWSKLIERKLPAQSTFSLKCPFLLHFQQKNFPWKCSFTKGFPENYFCRGNWIASSHIQGLWNQLMTLIHLVPERK